MIFNTALKHLFLDFFASTVSGGNLLLRSGTTVLATHSLNGFSDADAEQIVGNPVEDENATATGVVDNALLVVGPYQVQLTVSTIADGTGQVQLTRTDYEAGGLSQVAGITIVY